MLGKADQTTKGGINMADSIPIARVKRNQYSYFVGPDIAPVIEIDSGQEVVVETMDCFSGAITVNEQRFATFEEYIRAIRCPTPVAGPIAVKGAIGGDILAVHVLDIRVGMDGGRAITMVTPFFGGLANPHTLVPELGPDTKVCQIRGEFIDFPLKGRMVQLPVRPMIGTIWSAPVREKRFAAFHDARNCGNIDCPELSPGNTIYLPVTTPGGMVSLGDVHACMGDSEITGYGMETAADVHIRIDLIKQEDSHYVNCPQIESDRTIGSIGCHYGQPLGDNVKAAYRDMVMRLHRFYGFDLVDAYELVGQVGELRVHQTLENLNAVLVKLDKRYLA
jgi:amidase